MSVMFITVPMGDSVIVYKQLFVDYGDIISSLISTIQNLLRFSDEAYGYKKKVRISLLILRV